MNEKNKFKAPKNFIDIILSELFSIQMRIRNEEFGNILDSGTHHPDNVNYTVIAELKEREKSCKMSLEALRKIYFDTSGYSYSLDTDNMIISVTIPNGVTSIDTCIFREFKSLKEIYIPNSVVRIDSNTFADCDELAIYTPCGKINDAKKFNR